MTNKTFYELLNNPHHTKSSLQKLCFSMDLNGPQYHIIFKNNYSDLKDEIEKGDYDIEMITPINKIISNNEVKGNILSRLVNHNSC